MTVSIFKKSARHTTINKIKIGECFIYQDNSCKNLPNHQNTSICMAIPKINGEVGNTAICFNAVCLQNGTLQSIEHDQNIIPINVEISYTEQ